ncbi:phosphoglycerate kinase [candidate division WOR_3 bacterium SM23_60]|uniref:Phosphoglycerate kinase n=1 Tax=candidate division WOR_3 bacterium SM23_60 TaxID=1703780 RepID=A0A0S8GM79_UNCW3|nr:MAG: phosphoglycerate kinase [candidate division WOR_3 bacterium SM23_60]
MAKFSIKDLDLAGKKVFLRVDFNVPLDENLNIRDDTRIKAALPTIQYIIDKGGIPIIASHLGRPKGKIDAKLSLEPVAHRLEMLLNTKVQFAHDCIGDDVKKIAEGLKPGDVLLLENLRFHIEEKNNDANFARELASLADLYVNDAFGAAHRAHASVAGIAQNFDSPAGGFLMERELQYLDGALKEPKRPLLAIIGGAKVSTKIGVIKNLANTVDNLVIGGGMCFTFYKAKGYAIGKSLCEDELLYEAKTALNNPKLYLPVDVLVANEAQAGSATTNVEAAAIPEDKMGVDIGAKSVADIIDFIKEAKTIVWNGPMGIFEINDFARGTEFVAKAVATATKAGAVSIVGGGDTISALKKFNLVGAVSHASTGGGASLEYLEGKELPGIKALKEK